LSNLSGINFVAGTEVAERPVNMTLDNVGLEDVLQAIAYGCNVNYDFLPGRNIYLFRASSDAPEKSALLTRVFKLYYVRVSELKEIESSSGSSGGSSSGSQGRTSGGTSGGGLTTLSAPKEQGDSKASAIVKAIENILSERGKVSVDDRSNSLIVTDSEDRLKMIESAITQLDRPLDQVLINVILVETFEDLDRSLGIEWGDTNGVFGTISGAQEATQWPFRAGAVPSSNFFGNTGNTLKDTIKQFNPTNNSGTITSGVAATSTTSAVGMRDFSSFQIKVKALEDASKLKILAKPKILALDNQAALIKISTLAAIGNSTTTTGSSTETTNDTERYEIGTILRVTPLINTGGRITLTVEPTFATVEPSAISVSTTGSTGDPTTRTARTTLMVNDGQTIALGGMLFSTQSNGDRKVPFFGNIPVIGKAFFTSNTKSIKDRELILFVTPYIITDPSMLETPNSPDKRLSFDDEMAPFWKVKDKQWYKQLKDGQGKKTDFDGYFNVRQKLINSTLDTLDQNSKAPASSPK
ncbi:MAG: secretin N-terminal domain-containing protein, partial [Candidatus Omnitrophica bacterium]|nr:secretin N-terminal domain-containing protein [Candidatus Omnitrophota bacterium]